MVLATTNAPWDLDEALRRRLEKRIYIPLPDEESRLQMLELNLNGVKLAAGLELRSIARDMEGFSGADVKLVCRDASMMPMRRLVHDKSPLEIRALKDAGAELDLTLERADFEEALRRTKPSVDQKDIPKFLAWDKEFAST